MSGFDSVEQPSGWDQQSTQTALDNPSWQQPSSGGSSGWQGFGKLGMDLLGNTLPNVLGAAAGYGFNALMPGKTSLIDQRNPQQKGASAMGMDRMSALQKDPTSFGLPGDSQDPNTPAGKKLYDIRNNSRSADAARGMFTTGGSQQRETNAVNSAVGNEYNNIFNQSANIAQAGPGMTYNAKPNPWAQLFSGIASPAVKGLSQGIMRNFGLSTDESGSVP